MSFCLASVSDGGALSLPCEAISVPQQYAANMAVMLLGDAYLIEVFGRKANLIRPVHREGV